MLRKAASRSCSEMLRKSLLFLLPLDLVASGTSRCQCPGGQKSANFLLGAGTLQNQTAGCDDGHVTAT